MHEKVFLKKVKLLTNEQQESYYNANFCYICRETFKDKFAKDKKYGKARDYCHCAGKYRGAAHNMCNLTYGVLKDIPIVLHNGSNYNYHFIIKKLTEEFGVQFTRLGENT